MAVKDIMHKPNCNCSVALGLPFHKVSRLNNQLSKGKLENAIKTEAILITVEQYKWSRSVEEKMILDDLTFDGLYSKPSASIAFWEEWIICNGRIAKMVNDRLVLPGSRLVFVDFGNTVVFQNQKRLEKNPAKLERATNPKLSEDLSIFIHADCSIKTHDA